VSAIGQLRAQVEALVDRLVGEREAKQNARLDKIEKRLDALEAPAASTARKATSTTTTTKTSTSAKSAGDK
jgi:hypothetical protein